MCTDNWGRLLKIPFWKGVIQWGEKHIVETALLAVLALSFLLIIFGG